MPLASEKLWLNFQAKQNPVALWHGGFGVLLTQGFGHYQLLGICISYQIKSDGKRVSEGTFLGWDIYIICIYIYVRIYIYDIHDIYIYEHLEGTTILVVQKKCFQK